MSAMKSFLLDVEENNYTNLYKIFKVKKTGDLKFKRFSRPSVFAYIDEARKTIQQLCKDNRSNMTYTKDMYFDENNIPF